MVPPLSTIELDSVRCIEPISPTLTYHAAASDVDALTLSHTAAAAAAAAAAAHDEPDVIARSRMESTAVQIANTIMSVAHDGGDERPNNNNTASSALSPSSSADSLAVLNPPASSTTAVSNSGSANASPAATPLPMPLLSSVSLNATPLSQSPSPPPPAAAISPTSASSSSSSSSSSLSSAAALSPSPSAPNLSLAPPLSIQASSPPTSSLPSPSYLLPRSHSTSSTAELETMVDEVGPGGAIEMNEMKRDSRRSPSPSMPSHTALDRATSPSANMPVAAPLSNTRASDLERRRAREAEQRVKDAENKAKEAEIKAIRQREADAKREEDEKKAREQKTISFIKQFSLPASEQLIETYSCAIKKAILLHGRMYVSLNYVCFFSNIFSHKTNLVIPMCDILACSSASVALLFDNSIRIFVQTGPLPVPPIDDRGNITPFPNVNSQTGLWMNTIGSNVASQKEAKEGKDAKENKEQQPHLNLKSTSLAHSISNLSAATASATTTANGDDDSSAPSSPPADSVPSHDADTAQASLSSFFDNMTHTVQASLQLTPAQIQYLITIKHPNITEHFFASFLMRDHCLTLLDRLLTHRRTQSPNWLALNGAYTVALANRAQQQREAHMMSPASPRSTDASTTKPPSFAADASEDSTSTGRASESPVDASTTSPSPTPAAADPSITITPPPPSTSQEAAAEQSNQTSQPSQPQEAPQKSQVPQQQSQQSELQTSTEQPSSQDTLVTPSTEEDAHSKKSKHQRPRKKSHAQSSAAAAASATASASAAASSAKPEVSPPSTSPPAATKTSPPAAVTSPKQHHRIAASNNIPSHLVDRIDFKDLPPPLDDFTTPLDEILNGTLPASAADVFQIFFNDCAAYPLAAFGVQYFKDTEPVTSRWYAHPSSTAARPMMIRDVSYRKHIDSPIAPTTRVHQQHIYSATDSSFKLEITTLTPDVPFGDCLYVIERCTVENDLVLANTSRVRAGIAVRFIKQPWKMKPFVSLIKSRTRDDMKKWYTEWLRQADLFLRQQPIASEVALVGEMAAPVIAAVEKISPELATQVAEAVATSHNNVELANDMANMASRMALAPPVASFNTSPFIMAPVPPLPTLCAEEEVTMQEWSMLRSMLESVLPKHADTIMQIVSFARQPFQHMSTSQSIGTVLFLFALFILIMQPDAWFGVLWLVPFYWSQLAATGTSSLAVLLLMLSGFCHLYAVSHHTHDTMRTQRQLQVYVQHHTKQLHEINHTLQQFIAHQTKQHKQH